MIQLYRVNTGSCGGCDLEIITAVARDANLCWAASPQEADALLLTGPITVGSKAALLQLLQDVGPMPLLAIGGCAIDGEPFGKGGVQALAEVTTQLRLEGCPPTPEQIATAIHEALGT